MEIKLHYDGSVNSDKLGSNASVTGFKSQLKAAAAVFEQAFLDPITINIDIKVADLAGGAIGQSSKYIFPYAYPAIKKALEDDKSSLDDSSAVKHLPSSNSNTFYLTGAQLKALRLDKADGSKSDGTIAFDQQVKFDYSHSSSMTKTSYDFFGVAAHEISEILGRILPHDKSGDSLSSILDLFKSDRPFSGTTAGDFSIDQSTHLLAFNTDSKGDFGDWANSVSTDDAFRAFGVPGKVANVSDTDLRVMDVIGYDHKAADIAFVIDTTGSMTPYIDNVKANAVDLINQAFGTTADPIDARIGIVGFKDADGPDGPGETEKILNFTEQDTYADRKTAAVDAINSITVGGGGDIPEADNSGLLVALKGELGAWRKSAQTHKIILFSDAPVKDINLASQVQTLSHDLGVSVTTPGVSKVANMVYGDFTFKVPAKGKIAINTGKGTGGDHDDIAGILDPPTKPTVKIAINTGKGTGGDHDDIAGILDPPTKPTVKIDSQVYVIQVGFDLSATDGLNSIAEDNSGKFFTGDLTNLSDIIKDIISLPPPVAGKTLIGTNKNDKLKGGEGDDTIVGRGKNDKLKGFGGDDDLTGGKGKDHLKGGDGNDLLNGGAGRDNLKGDSGEDQFIFDKWGRSSKDKIADFTVGEDTIVFKSSKFKALDAGPLSADFLAYGQAAADSDDHVIYNPLKGILYYDPDGAGGKHALEVAFIGKELFPTSADFLVI